MVDPRHQRTRTIIRYVDPFLSPEIRGNSALSLEGLIRARVLAIILISSIVATFFSACVFLAFQILTSHNFENAIKISLGCLVISVLEYWYFYKSGNQASSAVLYSLSLFFVSTASIIVSGGYDSPVKQMYLICPMIAFLISGRQEGVYNAALILVSGIVLLILDSIGFELIQLMPTEILAYLSGVIWLVTIVMTTVCLYIYDLLLEDMRSVRAQAE